MVRWMLIGFVNISGSYIHNLTFVHSLVLALALHFYPPPVCNFCRRLIFHYCSVGFVIFSCQYFSPAALLHSSAQRSAFLAALAALCLPCWVSDWLLIHNLSIQTKPHWFISIVSAHCRTQFFTNVVFVENLAQYRTQLWAPIAAHNSECTLPHSIL